MGLNGFQGGVGGLHGRFPLGLELDKGFFAHMSTVSPALRELVQLAGNAFPLWALGVLIRPSLQLLNQSFALRLMGSTFLPDFFLPSLDHFKSTVARLVKSLPQRMVGQAALIGELPLLSQVAQGFLHFSAPHDGDPVVLGRFGRNDLLHSAAARRWGGQRGLDLLRNLCERSGLRGQVCAGSQNGTGLNRINARGGSGSQSRLRGEMFLAFGTGDLHHLLARVRLDGYALKECFGFGQEFGAQLIGSPTLPTFELAGRGQDGLRLVVEFFIDHARAFLQCSSELHRGLSTGFAVPLRQLGLEHFDGSLGALGVVGFLLGVDLWLGALLGRWARARSMIFDLFGPSRHSRQGFLSRVKCFLHLDERSAERLPNRLELLPTVGQGIGVLGVHTAPLCVCRDSSLFGHPGVHILGQTFLKRQPFSPGFGRQDLNALGHHDRRFALHLRPVLQVFHTFDTVTQEHFELGQRLP